jgi:hypothetical protein
MSLLIVDCMCESHACGCVCVWARTHVDTLLTHRTCAHTHACWQVATKKLWDASAAGDTHLVSLTEALGGGARVDWLDAEDRGNTALHKAAQVGALELVRALLMAKGCWGRGAAPSSRNAFNDTPLHAAAFKGHAAVADVLIEAQVCSSNERTCSGGGGVDGGVWGVFQALSKELVCIYECRVCHL